MIETIFLMLLVVFACLGICDFIHMIVSAVLTPKVKTKKYSIVSLKSGFAAEQLRYFYDKINWYGGDFCDEVICLVDDLSDLETSACECYCYKGNIHLCRLDNLIAQINFLETGEFDEGQNSTKE